MYQKILFLALICIGLVHAAENRFNMAETIPVQETNLSWYLEGDQAVRTLLALDDLPKRYQTLIKDFPMMQLLGSGVMGIIYSLPSETSNWDKETFKKHPLWWNWHYSVTHGPVIDPDSFLINYIEHPYVGASYYVWGRESGLNRFESTLITIALSTFYWEYGWEALIEPPSIQDLIITPVLGSLLGEQTYRIKQKIKNNGGYLWGSKKLGSIASIVLNPIGESNKVMKRILKHYHIETEVKFEAFYTPGRIPANNRYDHSSTGTPTGGRKGVRVHIKF